MSLISLVETPLWRRKPAGAHALLSPPPKKHTHAHTHTITKLMMRLLLLLFLFAIQTQTENNPEDNNSSSSTAAPTAEGVTSTDALDDAGDLGGDSRDFDDDDESFLDRRRISADVGSNAEENIGQTSGVVRRVREE